MRFMTVDVWVSLRARLAQLDSGGIIEPLTDCELITLRHLRGHQSVDEIASDLHVSVNTTKTHIRNIYRKLGVTCRRDAVRRSAALALP
jgi:LuxR family maltose regulon positive regulatory protein